MMQSILILVAVFITAIVGIFAYYLLPFIAIGALVLVIFLALRLKNSGYNPKSETYKELQKIKKRRQKADEKKFKYISDQLNYIQKHWGYTQSQEKIVNSFLEKRAYSTIYRKLSSSILPQLITLIDNCNNKEQKGCKREVNRRINEMCDILKKAVKSAKEQKQESYEISLEVLDRLLKELK